MTATHHLSRARLRATHGEALSAIAPLLIPEDPNRRAGTAHRLVWLLFQDIPDSQRDFLWRDDGDGKYMILSKRLPSDPHGLFDLDTKPCEPDLSVGDRLQFTLRANPTVARKGERDADAKAKRARGKRVDIVMDALHKIPKGERAAVRDTIASDAARQWLSEQGAKAGFALDHVMVESQDRVDIADHDRRRRRERAGISVLDMKGILKVTDPAAFLARLGQGFGSAKAFGNGLMLIRRA
jgi:CRISPR system Cascade subunit CasE